MRLAIGGGIERDGACEVVALEPAFCGCLERPGGIEPRLVAGSVGGRLKSGFVGERVAGGLEGPIVGGGLERGVVPGFVARGCLVVGGALVGLRGVQSREIDRPVGGRIGSLHGWDLPGRAAALRENLVGRNAG